MVKALISSSGGDLRRAITYLQSASRLSSSTQPPTPITPGDIQEIAGVVPDSILNDFAHTIGIDVESPNAQQKSGFEVIRLKVKELMREGYSATQLLNQVSCPHNTNNPY